MLTGSSSLEEPKPVRKVWPKKCNPYRGMAPYLKSTPTRLLSVVRMPAHTKKTISSRNSKEDHCSVFHSPQVAQKTPNSTRYLLMVENHWGSFGPQTRVLR